MNRNERRRHNAEMRKLPKELMLVPAEEWPRSSEEVGRFRVWRSRQYLVQCFTELNNVIRVSVSRVTIRKDGRWNDDITWDELQQIKHDIGYGDDWALEIYPADEHVVNVANMRHLWVMPDPPSLGWRNG